MVVDRSSEFVTTIVNKLPSGTQNLFLSSSLYTYHSISLNGYEWFTALAVCSRTVDTYQVKTTANEFELFGAEME